MPKHNPRNERIKRGYFEYLREARGRSEPSVDAAAKAIFRFEETVRFRDFKQFCRAQAIAFKRRLQETGTARGTGLLSASTIDTTLRHLREFFLWLAGQPGFRSALQYSDAEYFNLGAKEVEVARARRPKRFPTLEQMHRVLCCMPSSTAIERRDRAVVALALLTGARADALASLRLGDLNLAEKSIHQDARTVRTKFSKTFTTWFMPVGGNACEIILSWERELREDLLRGPADALFPATDLAFDEANGFLPAGLKRAGWKTSGPVREAFKRAFAAASLPYFYPHSLRYTLVRLGETCCHSPEEFKAWSQNLGHDGVMTTFMNYGHVSPERQAQIIADLDPAASADREKEIAVRRLLDEIAQRWP